MNRLVSVLFGLPVLFALCLDAEAREYSSAKYELMCYDQAGADLLALQEKAKAIALKMPPYVVKSTEAVKNLLCALKRDEKTLQKLLDVSHSEDIAMTLSQATRDEGVIMSRSLLLTQYLLAFDQIIQKDGMFQPLFISFEIKGPYDAILHVDYVLKSDLYPQVRHLSNVR
jgi:hypothetical protein